MSFGLATKSLVGVRLGLHRIWDTGKVLQGLRKLDTRIRMTGQNGLSTEKGLQSLKYIYIEILRCNIVDVREPLRAPSFLPMEGRGRGSTIDSTVPPPVEAAIPFPLPLISSFILSI